MTEEIKRFTLRLDAKLFEKIKKQAQQNKRATGKEIEYILDKSLEEKCKQNYKQN